LILGGGMCVLPVLPVLFGACSDFVVDNSLVVFDNDIHSKFLTESIEKVVSSNPRVEWGTYRNIQ
jgi:hypothetical protein